MLQERTMMRLNDTWLKVFLVLMLNLTIGINTIYAHLLSAWVNDSVKSFMARDNFPGFAAAFVRNGRMVWSQSYGVADIQTNKPMSLDGILNIGSVSKTFTATAVIPTRTSSIRKRSNAKREENIFFSSRMQIKQSLFPKDHHGSDTVVVPFIVMPVVTVCFLPDGHRMSIRSTDAEAPRPK
jgi:hypothetical protein